jgi:hypothetical protein
MIQRTLTIFNFDSTEHQAEQAEENPIFNYKRRPKTQTHSPYDRLGGN